MFIVYVILYWTWTTKDRVKLKFSDDLRRYPLQLCEFDGRGYDWVDGECYHQPVWTGLCRGTKNCPSAKHQEHLSGRCFGYPLISTEGRILIWSLLIVGNQILPLISTEGRIWFPYNEKRCTY